MELRPVQNALLAGGRAASRWATSTSTTVSRPSIPVSIYASIFSRPFSSTRNALQEAEAAAPLPSGGLAGYHRQRTQQQQQAQQQQQEENQSQPQPQPQQPQPQMNSIFGRSSPSDWKSPWVNRPSNAQILPASVRSARNTANDMLDLGLADQIKPDLADIEKQMLGAYYERPIDIKYRLRPVIGRTVELTTGAAAVDGYSSPQSIDFAKALARLDMQVKVNRVRADVSRQRFHERKGLKKKRLRSERWQRRFMDGFKATCKRVGELAKQGW